MNFIAKHLNALGIFLLTAFVATAAGTYFNVPARLTTSAALASAAKYSCPMHPEVVANRPGDCPKCGMTLISAAANPETKPMACQHDGAVGQTASGSAAAHAGCNHTEESNSGGCCSKKMQPVASPMPSGCTRNLDLHSVGSSE